MVKYHDALRGMGKNDHHNESHGAGVHDGTVEATANRGIAGGYAALNTSAKINTSNITGMMATTDLTNASIIVTGSGTTKITSSPTPPGTPTTGDLWVDTS